MFCCPSISLTVADLHKQTIPSTQRKSARKISKSQEEASKTTPNRRDIKRIIYFGLFRPTSPRVSRETITTTTTSAVTASDGDATASNRQFGFGETKTVELGFDGEWRMRKRIFGDSGEKGVESDGAGYPSHGTFFFTRSFKNLRHLQTKKLLSSQEDQKTETTPFNSGLSGPI